jgi:methionine-rich copper-binding protein CopC
MMGKRNLIAMFSLGATAFLLTGAAAFHLRLVKSAPADGEIVTQMPTEIRLWFSQKPEVGLTTVKLYRQDSSVVDLGKPAKTDDSVAVKVPLEAGLVPGSYTVSWRTVSRDGHPVRGSYGFTMLPGPPARKQAGGQ